MRESLKRVEVLRRRREIDAVLRAGRRIPGRALALRYRTQPETTDQLPQRRIAFILSSRIKPAVVRNRLKRRLREIFRRNKAWFPPGFDYIIQAGTAAAAMDFSQLKDEVEQLTAGMRNVN